MLSPIQFSKTDARGQSTGAGESSPSSQRCQEKNERCFRELAVVGVVVSRGDNLNQGGAIYSGSSGRQALSERDLQTFAL